MQQHIIYSSTSINTEACWDSELCSWLIIFLSPHSSFRILLSDPQCESHSFFTFPLFPSLLYKPPGFYAIQIDCSLSKEGGTFHSLDPPPNSLQFNNGELKVFYTSLHINLILSVSSYTSSITVFSPLSSPWEDK